MKLLPFPARPLLALLIGLQSLNAVAARHLQFWAVTGTIQDVQSYERLAVDFKAQTGIDVDVTPLGWGNFQTKYFAAMAAGLPPDIGITNLGGPFDYGTVGGLVDLRSEFPEETKAITSLMNPKLLPMFEQGDKLFGIPGDLSCPVLFYRTDIFAKLGLRPPKTWSELDRLIGDLEAKGYRYYYGFPSGAQWALNQYTLPYGITEFSMVGGKPTVAWGNPVFQKAVLEALSQWHMHDTPGTDLGNRVIGMFASDDPGTAVPLIIDQHATSSAILTTAPQITGKWSVAPWPRADGGKAFDIVGGVSYVIFRQSRMKREAIEWLKFLNTPDAQRRLTMDRATRAEDATVMISPLNDLWSAKSDMFWAQPQLQALIPLKNVIAQILPTFQTTTSLHGSTEAGRLEQNLLDQMDTFIRDRMDGIERKYGITRAELVRRFGAGDLATEKSALIASTAAELKAKYAAIAPQAEALLVDETAHYEDRYGKIVRNLPAYEHKRDVLTVAKAIAVSLLLLGSGVVVGVKRYRKHAISYAFIAPPLVAALVFVFVPAATALYLSFTDYHPVLPLSTARFVGFKNYVDTYVSGDLLASIWRTVHYTVITVPIGLVLALGVAFLLNEKLVGQRAWRFLYFSPLVTSVVSIALIFNQLFLDSRQGWLNAVLLKLGVIRDPAPFLTSEHSFLNCVIALAIWQGIAFMVLVFVAGMQQIPETLFEAAALDGAKPIRRFWNVALPGLRPQIFFVSVLGVIGAFQVFETIYVLAGKSGDAQARFGANDSAMTMAPLVYHTGFETFEMGKSAADAYVLFLLILALTAVQYTVYKRSEAKS
ncbi:MAG: extracellular solute-binding protein [Fimbriimonadaceae bacterium]